MKETEYLFELEEKTFSCTKRQDESPEKFIEDWLYILWGLVPVSDNWWQEYTQFHFAYFTHHSRGKFTVETRYFAFDSSVIVLVKKV